MKSHPLREDVSWNGRSTCILLSELVILFVRMWVEIALTTFDSFLFSVILFVRMWVEISYRFAKCVIACVILFVRMWVEISPVCRKSMRRMSSSSWGCELKYVPVEVIEQIIESSSSWGCELKFRWWSTRHLREWGHPLRENVSWNDVGYGRVGASCRHPPREDVSWNLEEYGVNHRCSNMVLLVGRWIEISLIVFLSFARRSYYYTSFNLNIKLNYRNLRGNF